MSWVVVHKRHINLLRACHRPKTLNIPLFYYKSMRKINIEEIGGDIERGDLKNCLQLLYLIHKTKSVCKGSLGITKTQKLSFLPNFSSGLKVSMASILISSDGIMALWLGIYID